MIYGVHPGGERLLTQGETGLARELFGCAVNTGQVRIRRRKWFALQPRRTVMAPCGHIHFHPESTRYSDDFSSEGPALSGLFVHEMTHVWQAQTRGRFWLPLMRHPFCRYDYVLEPGRRLGAYGIEQQAEIVRHAWLARRGEAIPAGIDRDELERLLQSIST